MGSSLCHRPGCIPDWTGTVDEGLLGKCGCDFFFFFLQEGR